MPRRGQRDKKLASVGIGPSVRHAEDSGCGVGELGDDFVGESAAVDGGAAAAGARGVAGLDHEVADDAVGGDGVVVACCGEGGEVVAGLVVGRVSFRVMYFLFILVEWIWVWHAGSCRLLTSTCWMPAYDCLCIHVDGMGLPSG